MIISETGQQIQKKKREESKMEMKERVSLIIRVICAIGGITFLVLSMLYDINTTRYLAIAMTFIAVANILNIKDLAKRKKERTDKTE